MSNLIEQKYKFDGIGKFSAVIVMRILSLQAWGLPFTVGLPGKITYFILKKVFSFFASYGLVIANITVEKVEELIQKGHFDQSMSDAIFSEISKGVTPERGKEIDAKVIAAFDQFVTFGKL